MSHSSSSIDFTTHLIELIPYIGEFLQSFEPIIAFFIFMCIGVFIGEEAEGKSSSKRTFLLSYLIVVCTLIFAVRHITAYYTFPLKLAQKVSKETHKDMTYAEAFDSFKWQLKMSNGSDDVITYALYTHRLQLTGQNYKEYAWESFKDIDDENSFIAYIINIVLQTIPMILTWILCTKLGWISEEGLIGIIFWYLVSIFLSYWGWNSKS